MTRGIMVIGEQFLVHHHTREKLNYDKVGLNFQQDRLHIYIVFACNKYCLQTILPFVCNFLEFFGTWMALNHAHGSQKSHKTYDTRWVVLRGESHTSMEESLELSMWSPIASCRWWWWISINPTIRTIMKQVIWFLTNRLRKMGL